MSAYACEPGQGSEPGTGWEWARAAALTNEVWVLTRSNNRTVIESALSAEPDLDMHPVYIDLPPWARWWKKGPWGVRLYYVLWQAAARRMAAALHREQPFDVAHHVTFATDWLPAGVVGIGCLPAVWGPVGGAAPFPWSLRRWLGIRGIIGEVGRAVGGSIGRRVFGDRAARSAHLVVAQNHEVARRFRRWPVIVEPHVAIAAVPGQRDAARHVGPGVTAVCVARIVPWKGVRLAIETLREPAGAAWVLRVFGEGRDRRGAERFARRLGVRQRVTFEGRVNRRALLRELAGADALLFPSMHDSGGWAVAEAIAVGLPVVCLDVGGPPVLLERTGGGIAVAPSHSAPALLADALGRASPPREPAAIMRDRLPALLNRWYGRATGADGASSRGRGVSGVT